MRQTVGNIQGYDVIYVPEKRILFCKNTAYGNNCQSKSI